MIEAALHAYLHAAVLIRFSHQMIELCTAPGFRLRPLWHITVTGMEFVSSIHLPRLPLIASNRVFSWKRSHQIHGVGHSIPILLALPLEIKQEMFSRLVEGSERILVILRRSHRLSWNNTQSANVRKKPF